MYIRKYPHWLICNAICKTWLLMLLFHLCSYLPCTHRFAYRPFSTLALPQIRLTIFAALVQKHFCLYQGYNDSSEFLGRLSVLHGQPRMQISTVKIRVSQVCKSRLASFAFTHLYGHGLLQFRHIRTRYKKHSYNLWDQGILRNTLNGRQLSLPLPNRHTLHIVFPVRFS